jgi:hypothetical protein
MAYECPGDTRQKKSSLASGWAFGSYSKSQNVGGEPFANGGSPFFGAGNTCRQTSDIDSGASTFIFVEDAATAGRGFNQGTWSIQWSLANAQGGHPQSFTGVDPVPMYHGDVSTFGFADAHAEKHKWTDQSLINGGIQAANGTGGGANFTPGTADYEYIYENYRFPGWRQ